MVTVLVVEDFQLFRQLLCSLLRRNPQIESIAEVTDGLQAVEKARELQPVLILLDIELPGINGIEAAMRIRQVSPRSKLIFVSSESSVYAVQRAFEVGAAGYLAKTDAVKELSAAMESVLEGKRFVSVTFSTQFMAGAKDGCIQDS